MARSYRQAGVDTGLAAEAVTRIARAAAVSATPNVLGGIGGFGGLFRFDPTRFTDPVLVSSTDGMGTKLKVAVALDAFDTLGEDLVHQSVNDIAVTGAEPLFFLDYLALGHLDPERVERIVAGIARACAALEIPLLGGETAQMPDVYRDDDLDLAGFVVGVADRSDLIDGSRAAAGDAVIGLPSSGLHTNGYTLARRILPPETWNRGVDGLPGTIGEALLAPHRSYLGSMLELRAALRAAGGDVGAFSHITGGGWSGNIPRTLPDGLGVVVNPGSWTVPFIFTLLQQRGDIEDAEMAHTFNLGIGLTAVVPSYLTDVALAAVPSAALVGRVVAVGPGEERVVFE
ncbi:MAG: phosphoribosylformylglycinamidine cyclo-ligase [Chloroflexota bacterium]